MICLECGLPATRDCARDHVQRVVSNKKIVAKAASALPDQSIHPRVVNGRTAHAKVNTAKAPKK